MFSKQTELIGLTAPTGDRDDLPHGVQQSPAGARLPEHDPQLPGFGAGAVISRPVSLLIKYSRYVFCRFCLRYSVGLIPSTRRKHWEK